MVHLLLGTGDVCGIRTTLAIGCWGSQRWDTTFNPLHSPAGPPQRWPRRCAIRAPFSRAIVTLHAERLWDTHQSRPPATQGEHLLHVLNLLESRAVVLDAELREVDEDLAQNAAMGRKYGAEYFTEGNSRLQQTRVRSSSPAAPTNRVRHARAVARRRRRSSNWQRSGGS